MKQQTPLFIAMGILVLYSLIFLQEKTYQYLPLSDCINIAKNNSEEKQIASIKVDFSKSRLKQSESGLWPSLELISKAFIQDTKLIVKESKISDATFIKFNLCCKN
jgi:hypothetical protein